MHRSPTLIRNPSGIPYRARYQPICMHRPSACLSAATTKPTRFRDESIVERCSRRSGRGNCRMRGRRVAAAGWPRHHRHIQPLRDPCTRTLEPTLPALLRTGIVHTMVYVYYRSTVLEIHSGSAPWTFSGPRLHDVTASCMQRWAFKLPCK